MSLPGAGPPIDRRGGRAARWIAAVGVAAVLAVIAVDAGIRFHAVARFRWEGLDHDRHAHCLTAMEYAAHLRAGRIFSFLREINSARMWPPLHGLLAGAVMTIGGLDSRLAHLPSLAAWAVGGLLVFLLARRLSPRAGTAAGLSALVFFLQSPAHRAFATDVMLESLGACLTLLILYLHARALEVPSAGRYRSLGLALTALFLTKFNYWLLAALALLADAAVRERAWWRGALRSWAAGFRWREWVRAQVRHPLTWVFLALLLSVPARQVLRAWRGLPPKLSSNLIHLAFVALVARVAHGWWRSGRRSAGRGSPALRQLALWHGVPVLVWFLLPKHLGYFLLYLSPWNGPNSEGGIFAGLAFYGRALFADFHREPWSAVLGLALAAAGALAARRGAPGSRAVVLLAVIAAFLAAKHPNRQNRFLTSWLPAGWVLSGMGGAWLITSFRPERWRRTRLALAGAAAVALAALLLPGSLTTPGARAGGGTPLEISDTYLPLLEASRTPAFFSTVPISYFFHWTYRERYPGRDPPVLGIEGFDRSAEANRARFREWVAADPADTIVFLDIPPGSRFHFARFEHYAQFRELVGSLTEFRQEYRKDFPEYGCWLTILRRS